MPATGKSTLAEQLGQRLGWPVFTKDTLKETLFDAAGHAPATIDEDVSDGIGTQAVALLLHIARTLLTANVSVVLEANFRSTLAAQQFAPILDQADVRHVYCTVETERMLERYAQRLENDERHPVHVDTGNPEELAAQLDAKDYGPIPLPIPTLIVQTDDGFSPSREEVVAFCRA
jgi:predicted kinase